jgi:two-component system, NtrC family, C4-dicarboxylate transport response regulator DctD
MQGITPQKEIAGRNQVFHQTRILLVDEDLQDLDHYRRVLYHCGFEVKACTDFGEAAHLLETASFDFVVASQGGPRFEGRLVLEHSMARDRYLPVVIVCRHHDVACYLEAMQLGAVDYLEKPLSALEVLHVVTTHLQPHHAAA